MFRFKVLISVVIFSTLLIGTSIIKNQTRIIEKKIYNLSKEINLKENDYNESQLDFFYLTSPSVIEQKIHHIDNHEYSPMKYSNIFLSMSEYLDIKKKIATKKDNNEKKIEKK